MVLFMQISPPADRQALRGSLRRAASCVRISYCTPDLSLPVATPDLLVDVLERDDTDCHLAFLQPVCHPAVASADDCHNGVRPASSPVCSSSSDHGPTLHLLFLTCNYRRMPKKPKPTRDSDARQLDKTSKKPKPDDRILDLGKLIGRPKK